MNFRVRAGPATPRAISSRATLPPRKQRLVLVLFFGAFFLTGLIASHFVLIKPWLSIHAAKSWQPAPAEVVSSRVKNHDSDGSTTYSVDIVYRYRVAGRAYTSNRYAFISASSSGYASKDAIVKRLPPGAKITCYVNPADPTDVVLERELNSMLWIGLIPLSFALVGAAGIFAALTGRLGTGSRPTPGNSFANPGTLTPAPTLDLHGQTAGDSAGPATLAPSASRGARLAGILIFAIFWNGIVSIFLVQILNGWNRGSHDWGLGLFMVPFVLVGLGTIGAAIYQAMALFNPRPRLTVSRRTIAPGETFEISWEFSGHVERLRRLRVFVEGREEATYRRGTDTRTDREIFATLPALDTGDPAAIRSGSTSLRIPSRAMHSFKSNHNRIVWSLRLKGEVPRWPDVDDEYPLEITPAPATRSGHA